MIICGGFYSSFLNLEKLSELVFVRAFLLCWPAEGIAHYLFLEWYHSGCVSYLPENLKLLPFPPPSYFVLHIGIYPHIAETQVSRTVITQE